MNIIQIVRRYGPVGGMERYVWQVSNELLALGHHVEVICERSYVEKHSGIVVHELGEIAQHPRWLSLLRFSWKVKTWLERNPRHDFLIHSNERIGLHNVSTFHSQPFASVRDKPWWKRMSLRVVMQLYLEWRELYVAQVIVPNSSTIRTQLLRFYPQFKNKLTRPITPGVITSRSTWQVTPVNGGVVAFVGIEWKRKGLPLAISIVKELRKIRPELELWVIGPQEEKIKYLFDDWKGGYRLLGWNTNADYLNKIDVLLHPARFDAYGMVIAEAMAAQIPVVISDACGVADDVCEKAGKIVPLQSSLDVWVNSLEVQLQRTVAPPIFVRNWAQVASEYISVYQLCLRNYARQHDFPASNALSGQLNWRKENDAMDITGHHAALSPHGLHRTKHL